MALIFDLEAARAAAQRAPLRSLEFEASNLLLRTAALLDVEQRRREHKEYIKREGFGQIGSLNSEVREARQRVKWAYASVQVCYNEEIK